LTLNFSSAGVLIQAAQDENLDKTEESKAYTVHIMITVMCPAPSWAGCNKSQGIVSFGS
jgi:hypothetical protein